MIFRAFFYLRRNRNLLAIFWGSKKKELTAHIVINKRHASLQNEDDGKGPERSRRLRKDIREFDFVDIDVEIRLANPLA